ncbi:MAG: CpaF family protein [Deltaproteobacteria bacterium]|nr:CpaF family protein [Deltaproteobacteria bacterium]
MRKVSNALLAELDPQQPADRRLLSFDDHEKVARRRALSPALCHVLREVQRELGYERRDSGLEDPQAAPSIDVSTLIKRSAERLGFDLTSYEKDEILSYVERDEKPFGLLQPLVDDTSISDIIVSDFSKVSIQQGRRNFSTDIVFPSPEVYENFVERLLQRAGTTYSTKKPIADGMIGSYARIHVVHRSLCDTGPYLTIRLNRFSSVGVSDLVSCGLAPLELFDYLQALIRGGRTILIVGEVGTGKTTLVRALAGSIPMQDSILVIEDTPEIRLEHPHVRYITTREANSDGAGRVAPSECIRAGMRMAMNRIIFGEIRDAEAAEAFIDVCASGHPGVSTVHGRSSMDAVARLELFLGRAQKGVQRAVLSEQIATAVHVLVHVDICRESGRRRVMDVREIGPVADGTLRQRQMFQYQVQQGLATWKVVNKISAHRELLESDVRKVVLAMFPSLLELNPAQQLEESMRGRSR